MDLISLETFIKKFGLKRTAKILSCIFWVFLSLLIWYQLYLLFPFLFPSNIVLTFLGIFLLIILFNTCLSVYSLERYGFSVIKKMGIPTDIFKDPSAKETVEEFKQQNRKLIIPFSQQSPILLGFLSSIKAKSKIFFITLIFTVITSYLIANLIISFRSQLLALFEPYLQQLCNYFPQFSDALHYTLLYPIIGIAVFWFLSLYYTKNQVDFFIHPSKYKVQRSTYAVMYLFSVVDLYNKLLGIFAAIVSSIVNYADRNREFTAKPFLDPMNLPRVIKKAVENAEGGEPCFVSLWRETALTKEEIVQAKKAFMSDNSIPSLLRATMRLADAGKVSEWLENHNIMSYSAFRGDRCVFVGCICYDPIKKVRIGEFFFDTSYLKQEFVKIYKRNEAKQREIAVELPSELPENFALDVIGYDRE